MPYNLYGGFAIFGFAVKMNGRVNERAAQRNVYAGLSGVELLDLGGRGRTTHVRGRLAGVNLADLMDQKDVLESAADNMGRLLYDSAGLAWSNVVVHPPQFEGRWTRASGPYLFQWGYELNLEHLTDP